MKNKPDFNLIRKDQPIKTIEMHTGSPFVFLFIHGLIDLPSNVCLSDFMHLIKGSSSRWANKNKLFDNQFLWQRGYGGLSVSCRQVQRVCNYIKYQSKHHKTYTFSKEYEEWQKEYGIFDD